MLRFLRQGGVGQALMAAIVFAIIAVFLLEFRSTSGMQTASLQRECAVTLDGTCLNAKDYFAEFGLVVPRGLPPKQVKDLQLRKVVLEGLIERELLAREAERLGLGAGETAVKDELRLGRAHVSLPAAQALRLGYQLDLVSIDESGSLTRDLVRELPIFDPKTNEVDDDLYARVVRTMSNRSPKEFVKMQERELLAARMRDVVRARVRVADAEAFDAFRREKSGAVIRFARLDPEWFARWGVDTSDAAVDRHAEAHRPEVDEAWKAESPKFTAGCPLGSEIAVLFPREATEAQKSLAKDRIDLARATLDSGAPFDVVARQVSNGDTARVGGRLGCLTAEGYGEGGDVIAKAVAGLAPGAVSPVLETKRGYHIVRVDGLLGATEVEAVGRRTLARPLAVQAAAEAAAKDVATRLIAAVKGGARLDDTLAAMLPGLVKAEGPAPRNPAGEGASAIGDESPALKDLRAPRVEVSAPFGVDGDPVPGALGGPPLGRLAFQLAKADDVHPEPVATTLGLLVLQLKEKTEATREEFEAGRAEIVRKLELAKRNDALIRYVARLRQAVSGKIEINERLLEEPKTADQQ